MSGRYIAHYMSVDRGSSRLSTRLAGEAAYRMVQGGEVADIGVRGKRGFDIMMVSFRDHFSCSVLLLICESGIHSTLRNSLSWSLIMFLM